MKFLRRILIFALIIFGVIGVVWEIWGNEGFEGFKGFEGRVTVEPAKPPEDITLKFAVMSDIHSDWENFRKALEKAKTDMGVGGFVVITGDLTTIGKKSELLEAKKILDESGLKYYVIPGNHDLWWGREYKRDVWKEVFGESFTSFKTDAKKQRSKVSEIKFILVNNADGVGGIEGVKGFGGEKEREWLRREVEGCLKIYCLVFMHMPLNHPNSLHVMGEGNTSVASEAGRIKKMLDRNGVKEIFAGHLHFSSSYELDGLKTTIVGAVASERNFQSPKFLEIEVRNKELKKKEVFIQ